VKVITVETERQSIINVSVGNNVRLFNFVNAYHCSIDDNSKIGAFVEIQKNATIGKNCKISSHSFICEGVRIDDNVFVGHNVTFINDKYPSAVNDDGTMQTDNDWGVIGTHVKKGASIGSSATIICGVVIGEDAIVGAGSVVTKDVAPRTVVAGNPARFIRSVDLKHAAHI